jgi:hypothetical protein
MTKDFGSFKWLTGDVNYTDHGGKWLRRVPGTRRYHVIELNRWDSLVGEREARLSELPTYNLTLREVDLDLLCAAHETEKSESSLASALRSCGWYLDPRRGVVQEHDHDLVCALGGVLDSVLVEACHGYGAAAPLEDLGANNWRKCFDELRKLSVSLDDESKHDQAMDRPVNAVCTSAQDYMLGRLFVRASAKAGA